LAEDKSGRSFNSDSKVSPASFQDFLQSVKHAFKAASIYQPNHPALNRTIQNLKHEIDQSLAGGNCLKLSFTTRSIVIGDQVLESEKLHAEIAEFFHFRRIKSISFNKGVTEAELRHLIISLHRSRNEHLKSGLASALTPEAIPHIILDELNYSQLLQGEGDEIKDIWAYMLGEAVANQDENKIDEVVEDFDRAIDGISPKDMTESIVFQENISKFFSYLEENKNEDFRSCAKKLIKNVINDNDLTSEDKVENLTMLISDLSEEDLASTLWEEIISNKNFNSLNFSIFSRLIQKERHSDIANSLSEIFKENEMEAGRTENKEKMKELLAGTSTPMISAIYAQTLSTFMQDIKVDEKLTFEQVPLFKNYRYILLNLLACEDDPAQFSYILDKIDAEWKRISTEHDYEYLRFLYDTVQKISKRYPSNSRLEKSTVRLIQTIEEFILSGEVSLFFEYFLQKFEASMLDVNCYLEKIFQEGKITAYILKGFFKFFTEYLFYFNLNLDQKSGDSRFLEKLTSNLALIDSPISVITLKNIFSQGQPQVKLKVLKAMQKLTEYDPKFLFSVLKGKNMSLKAEALVIIMREEKFRQKALDGLLKFESPFGIRNRRLHENIKILEEKNMRSAETALIPLRMRKGFWNRNIRARVNRVLEHWHAGQN